jgi:hypothetical protein
MSKTNSKRRRIIEDEEEEEEDQEILVDHHVSSSFAHEGSLSDRVVADIVRLFLFKSSRDEFVRGTDVRAFRPDGDSRSNKSLVQSASAVLFDVFGLEIVQLVQKNSGEVWMVRNQLRDPPIGSFSEDKESLERLGLVSAICALLRFNGGRVRDSQINSFISEHLGFTPSPEQLKDLVTRKYLVSINSGDSNELVEYASGPRSSVLLGDLNSNQTPLKNWINSISL